MQNPTTIQPKWLISSLGIAIGFIFYILLFGLTYLDPSNISWRLEHDPASHFIGWYFFRNEAWHFPLGVIENLLYPMGTSLIYTDSIPLLAIPLKLFSPLLPEVFQYFGLWLLLCYALQGLFAGLIMRRFSSHLLIIILGITLFVMSPVMVQRSWGHAALTGHWVLLAAIYGYFLSDVLHARVFWLALLCATAMIHFYLLAMVLILWGTYLIRQLLEQPNRWLSLAGFFGLGLSSVLLIMWSLGYFIIDTGQVQATGLGHYSMNLISPINPSPFIDTTFLKPFLIYSSGQFEGFNYLGLGVLLLLMVAIFEWVKDRTGFNWRRDLPLIAIASLLFVLALSYKVTFLNHILFTIPLPEFAEKLLGILRSSGRLFWPVSYLLLVFGLVLVIYRYRPRVALFILFCVASIQFIDLWPYYKANDKMIAAKHWQTPLTSPVWPQLMAQYDHIVFYPPDRKQDYYLPFAMLAAEYRKTINVAYVARMDINRLTEYETALNAQLQQGQLDPNTLYVVSIEMLPKLPAELKAQIRLLNDYLIIAPNLALQHSDLQRFDDYLADSNNRPIMISLMEFMLRLEQKNQLVLISVKDDARAHLSESFVRYLQQKGSRIEELGFRGSYAAIIDDGELVEEAVDNENEVELRYQLDHAAGNISFYVASAGGNTGSGKSVILASLAQQRYSLAQDSRGLNIVIINKEPLGASSYVFDTYVEENPVSGILSWP